MKYWPLRQQSNIFVTSARVVFSNFGPTTDLLLLLYHVFLFPFPPDNSAIWHLSQSLICSFCISQVWQMSLLIFYPPPPQPTRTVAATVAADPVDFEEMAAEQTAAWKHSIFFC